MKNKYQAERYCKEKNSTLMDYRNMSNPVQADAYYANNKYGYQKSRGSGLSMANYPSAGAAYAMCKRPEIYIFNLRVGINMINKKYGSTEQLIKTSNSQNNLDRISLNRETQVKDQINRKINSITSNINRLQQQQEKINIEIDDINKDLINLKNELDKKINDITELNEEIDSNNLY